MPPTAKETKKKGGAKGKKGKGKKDEIVTLDQNFINGLIEQAVGVAMEQLHKEFQTHALEKTVFLCPLCNVRQEGLKPRLALAAKGFFFRIVCPMCRHAFVFTGDGYIDKGEVEGTGTFTVTPPST